MKKLLVLLLALIMCLTALTSCDVNDILGYIVKPVETETYDVDSALAYLKNMYKGDNSVTATDYEVVGQIYISGVKYTVTWTSSNEKVKVEALENGNWLINVDEKSEADETYTLTATITAPNGDTRTHSYERSVPKYNVLSWDEYMNAAENDVVLVEGIVVGMNSVSKGNKRNHLFLADASGKGGYYCYILEKDPVTEGIQVGMTVSVSGTVSPYSGMQEIKNCTATIVDKTIKEVKPIDMTSVFSQDKPDYSEYVGRLVTIKDVKIGSQDLATETSQYLYFTIGGVKGYVRTYVTDMCHEVANADAKATIDAAHAEHFGWTADATGILILYSGNPYLIPVSTTPFDYKELVQATAAEKIADSIDAISVASKVASDTTITLPLVGANYSDVSIAWKSDNECATIDSTGKLTITLQDEAQKVTLTATLTCGETTETRTYTIDVPAKPTVALTVVDAPVDGGEYYLMSEQTNLGKNLFFTGTMSGNFCATTEDYTAAIKVKTVATEGGFYIQVGTQYLGVGSYTNTKGNTSYKVTLDDAATTVFVWNTEHKTFTTTLEGTDLYIGTYNEFTTLSASKLSYISTSFPSHLITIGTETVISDGEYTIAAGDVLIGALGETVSYGYLPKADTAALFTVKNVAGGVTIQDSYGRFLYMSGTYNSFQLGTEAPADGSNIWKVTKNDDGTYTFVNAVTEKTMAYNGSYSSVGAYATVADGNVSTFTLTAKSGSEEHTHNITDDNFTPEQPATCTSQGKKGHFYCEVCQKAFDREGNEIEDLTIEALGHDFNIWGDCSRCEHTEKVELKVYYKNTKNWENVYVWAWYHEGQNICEAAGLSWPGMPISKVEGTDDWYVASVNLHTLENIKFLFNGGNNVGQTQDVVYDATKLYMYNNTLYATQAEADAAYVADFGVTWSDLYIRGDMNGWETSNQLKVNPDDESAYIEIDLIAGQKFKIATDTWSYEINWSFVQDTVNFEADGSDIKVVNSGTYTFVVSKDWTTLTITKKHTHEWGDGVVTTDPTCTNTGVRTFTCSCGETKTEEIPVDPEAHVWGTDFTEDKAATCTEAGSKSIHCTLCTATKDTTAIDALGHEIVGGKCTHEGCTVAVPTEEGKVTLYFTLGEDSVEIPDYAVPYITGGAWGWADWCVKGAEQFTHLEGTDVWYVVSNITFTAGEGEYKVLLNVAAMDGHAWQNKSVTHGEGNAKYVYTEGQKVVDLGEHGFSSVPSTDPATVTNWVVVGSFNGWNNGAGAPLTETATKGVFETIYLDVPAGVEYKITNGNWASGGGIEVVNPETAGNFKIETAGKYKLVFNVNTWTVTVVAEEHVCTFDNWTDEVSATCIKEGTKGHYTCSCGKKYDKDHNELTDLTIDKAEHTWSDWTTTATCTEAGEKSRHCTVEGCTATETETDAALGHADKDNNKICDHGCGEVYLEDGLYDIYFGDIAVGVPYATSSFSYLYKATNPVPYTLAKVEGGYTIVDIYDRYLYMSGSYNSFQLNKTSPADGTEIWVITGDNESGMFTIVNSENGKTIAYSTSYGSAGAYAEVGEGSTSAITVKAHEHVYVNDVTKAATCTEAGTAIPTCACGDTKDEIVVLGEHTCDNGGRCTVCNRWVLESKDLSTDLTAEETSLGGTNTVGFFTIAWKNKTAKVDTVESAYTWNDGYTAVARINFGGKLQTKTEDSVKRLESGIVFTVTEATTVRVWWVHGGNVGEATGRQLTLKKLDADKISLSDYYTTSIENTKAGDAYITEISIEEAGTYALGSPKDGTYIFKVEVDGPAKYNPIKDDFSTVSANSKYLSRSSTNGWIAENTAVIVVNGSTSFTMNGKTSAVGKITSPVFENGIKSIAFSYANTFSESKGVDITIEIQDDKGNVLKTQKLDNDSVTQGQKYTYTWELDTAISGSYKVVFKNNSPTNSSSNKDRVSIFDIVIVPNPVD